LRIQNARESPRRWTREKKTKHNTRGTPHPPGERSCEEDLSKEPQKEPAKKNKGATPKAPGGKNFPAIKTFLLTSQKSAKRSIRRGGGFGGEKPPSRTAASKKGAVTTADRWNGKSKKSPQKKKL